MVVNKNVLLYAHRLGFDDSDELQSDSMEQAILRAIDLATPFTHPKGNRRYKEWIFAVNKHSVNFIHLIKCDACLDRKRIQFIETCELCGGGGCSSCRNGNVNLYRACPECT